VRETSSYDPNAYLIAGAAKSDDATVWRVDLPQDDPERMKAVMNDELIRADLLMVAGGWEDEDAPLRSVVAQLGPADFGDLAMEPGSKQGFAVIGEARVPVLLMPTDPVAAYASYIAFARPVIRKLMGITPYRSQPQLCYASKRFVSKPGVLEFIAAVTSQEDGKTMVTPVADPAQRRLVDLVAANALAGIPTGKIEVDEGQPIMCWLLDN
jgi:molybdopterin molybdotransferase